MFFVFNAQHADGKNSADDISQYSFYVVFLPENRLCHFMEIIYIKCQSQFSEKNKDKYNQFVVC